jgi:hypothetical protein
MAYWTRLITSFSQKDFWVMHNRDGSYPRWSAPFIGAIMGGVIALKVSGEAGNGFSPTTLGMGAAVGGLAGALIFLIDVQPKEKETLTSRARDRKLGIEKQNPGTLMSRFFAVLSPLLSWVPFLNVIWSIAAFLMNRKVQGWPKTISKIGLVLTVLFCILFGIILSQK